MQIAAAVEKRYARKGDGPNSLLVMAIQIALNAYGSSLLVDGDFGDATEAAVRRLQAGHRLEVDGRVGPKTGKVLDKAPAPSIRAEPPRLSVKGEAPWLTFARSLSGTKELPGSANSSTILGWNKIIAKAYPDLAAYTRQYTNDAIPWCGLAEAIVMTLAGIKPVTKKDGAQYGYLWADDWKHFGKECEPVVGAVLVFTRKGGGHVSTMEGQTKTHYLCRGGNQSNAFNVTSVKKSQFTTARWPSEYPVINNILGITTSLAPAGSYQ